MDIWVWIGLAVLMAVIAAWRIRWKTRGRLGAAFAQLARLCERERTSESAPSDLQAWESALADMEKYPSEYNKLNGDIEFVSAFTAFLERHYPDDSRLERLHLAGAAKKTSIWGFTVKRD